MALDLLARLARALCGRGAVLAHLRALALRLPQLRLQASHLGRRGGELAVQPGDVTLHAGALVARVGKLALRLCNGLPGLRQRVLELRYRLAQRADPALALERALLRPGRRANGRPPVREHGHALRRHVRKRGRLRVRLHGLAHAVHEPHVPQQGVHKAARAVSHRKRLRNAPARRPGCVRAPRRGVERHDRGHALRALAKRLLHQAHHAVGVARHERREVLAQKRLHDALQLRRRLEQVRHAALDRVRPRLRERGDQGARVLRLAVHGLQRGERRLRGGQSPPRVALGRSCPRRRLLALADAPRNAVLPLAGLCQRLLGSLSLRAPALERLLRRLGTVLDLLQAALEHLVLDLGVRDLVAQLRKRERLCVGRALRRTHVARELRHALAQLAPALRRLARRGPKLAHAPLQVVRLHARVGVLALHALVLLGGLARLALHGRQVHAHLGEALHHVLALFLQKAHVGVHAAQQVLHAAALLAQVPHEDALLLQEGLVLLEVPVLLVQAVLRQLDGGVSLLAACGERAVAVLQLAEVVHQKRRLKLLQLPRDVAVVARLVHLALQRAQLAVYLALDVLGARQVVLHRLQLALGALLATAVLRYACRLLHQLAALLRAACQDGVQLSLADDGVRVLAEAGVVQDVRDVAQARRRAVDEVLRLPGAVHPARDRDLGEVDRQRAVRVVQHDRDLGQADGLPAGRPREDHVLHRLAAQHLRALLAQHPQDRVRYVRLAAAVWPDHDREAGVEHQLRLVREGLESLERERLQIHVVLGLSGPRSAAPTPLPAGSPCARARRARPPTPTPSSSSPCRGPRACRPQARRR